MTQTDRHSGKATPSATSRPHPAPASPTNPSESSAPPSDPDLSTRSALISKISDACAGILEPSRRSAAKPDRTRRAASPISPIQLQVIEKLLLGTTITETAAAFGLDRSTIHRWLNEDSEFQAEYNRRHNNLKDSLDDKLLNIAIGALPHLEKTIRRNVWAILALLKGVGALSGARFISRQEDPREIARNSIL